jgi:hypothetical protein
MCYVLVMSQRPARSKKLMRLRRAEPIGLRVELLEHGVDDIKKVRDAKDCRRERIILVDTA